MKNVRDFSIRTKLSLMIILTSVITMLIACSILTISDRSQSRDRLVKDLNNLANIIVANSTSAVSFDDEKAAREALTSLGAYEQITGALILKSDGKPFASYARKQAEQLPATQAGLGSGCHFQDGWVDCVQEMRVDGKLIGMLIIRSDLSLLAERLRWFTGISALIVLLTSILAVVIGEYLQRMISRPIGEISRIAEAVAVGDILQEIKLTQADEIGKLAESFRKIISYMKHLASASERIAANDLTVRIEPKSERDLLGNSFRTMLINLNSMIRQLAEDASRLVEVASQIASSSEEMSKGAKEQADQINQVSSAVEEMTAVIQESSKNASAAAEVASGSCDTATSGGQVVSDTIHGMQRIAQVVRESSESIAQLAKSADQIGEISSVIDDIADQTNLLALNAAIEAARAGEQGRGFAVVADEVRRLAERTGSATGEIAAMIKGIQRQTEEAVTSMKTGIQEINVGRDLADRAGSSLSEIVAMSQRVTDMIQQIATASEEQSSAAGQISRNIEHISSVTKETATGADQSAAAAEELNRQADGLQQMVHKFKVCV